MIQVSDTPLAGLLVITPQVFQDKRGYFFETFKQSNYAAFGLPNFVQDNISHSKQNVLRGLHYQLPHAQGKLIGVINGKIFDVAVDIRKTSKTFGQWFSIILSDEDHRQFYIPPGFAHGFCVLSATADIYYKCSALHTPLAEHGIAWHDQALNIPWPVSEPILSGKDERYPVLAEVTDECLF